MQRTGSKKSKRPMPSFQTTKSELNTTDLGTAGPKGHPSVALVEVASTSISRISSAVISSPRFLEVGHAEVLNVVVQIFSFDTPFRSVMYSSVQTKRWWSTSLNRAQHVMEPVLKVVPSPHAIAALEEVKFASDNRSVRVSKKRFKPAKIVVDVGKWPTIHVPIVRVAAKNSNRAPFDSAFQKAPRMVPECECEGKENLLPKA